MSRPAGFEFPASGTSIANSGVGRRSGGSIGCGRSYPQEYQHGVAVAVKAIALGGSRFRRARCSNSSPANAPTNNSKLVRGRWKFVTKPVHELKTDRGECMNKSVSPRPLFQRFLRNYERRPISSVRTAVVPTATTRPPTRAASV